MILNICSKSFLNVFDGFVNMELQQYRKTANLQMHKKTTIHHPPINQTPNLQTIKIHKT